MESQWGVVVVAAGRGSRMGTKESKQYLPLRGKPIIVHTLELFESMDEIADIALVVGADDVERCSQLVQEHSLGKVTAVVSGGGERQQSVYAGIKALSPAIEWVMVHDGVRPLVTPDAIRACCTTAEQVGAAVLGVPVKDTIKQVDEAGLIVATPDRRSLWAIQTPQAFRRELLVGAHERAEDEQFLGTDDAMVVERTGAPVAIAEGEYTNIKITTPDDLPWAEFLLGKREKGEGQND